MSLKKGVGVIKNNRGRGVTGQNKLLADFERFVGLSAKATALILGTSYNTYKAWKGERREMTGPTLKLIDILMSVSGTPIGTQFGI